MGTPVDPVPTAAPDKTCNGCAFYEQKTKTCHVAAPTLLASYGGGGLWPIVQPTDWCGDWKQATP